MNITYWIENPEESPSYNMQIGLEYDEELGKNYPVGQQWPMNAVYHDVVDLLSNVSDETVTMLYHDIQITTGKSIRYYGVEGYDKQIFNIFAFLSDKSLLLVSGGGLFNPEDEFVNVKYVTQSGQELSFEELNQLTDQQLQQDPPVDTRQFFKDAYYDTMFYRTYIGITSEQDGTISEPDYQLPCLNMKHFYAEYISPPEYMYYQGKGAVVIAKYYAGAFINGSVSFNGEPVDVQVVVQKNITQYGTEIPVDHDQNITTNGTFSVIAPAGNITLQIRRNVELGQNAFVLKNVTFNQFDKSEYAIISDNEAMRMTDNYSRYVDISIDPVNPTEVGSAAAGGEPSGLWTQNNYLFVSMLGDNQVEVYSLTDPLNPSFEGSFDTSENTVDLTGSGNYLYVAQDSTSEAIVVYDISSFLRVA